MLWNDLSTAVQWGFIYFFPSPLALWVFIDMRNCNRLKFHTTYSCLKSMDGSQHQNQHKHLIHEAEARIYLFLYWKIAHLKYQRHLLAIKATSSEGAVVDPDVPASSRWQIAVKWTFSTSLFIYLFLMKWSWGAVLLWIGTIHTRGVRRIVTMATVKILNPTFFTLSVLSVELNPGTLATRRSEAWELLRLWWCRRR